MRRLKSIGIGLFIMTLVFSLAACGANGGNAGNGGNSAGSEDKEDVVKLTVMSHYIGQNESFLIPLIEQWNEENPNIQVELRGVSFGELQTAIMTQQSAGQAADIVHFYTLWGGQFANANVLAEAPQDVVADIEAHYPDAAISGASINGQIYGYPTEVNSYALFYNKRLLEEAGYNAPPETWDELLDMAAGIEQKDANGQVQVQGFGFQRGYAGLVVQPFMAMMAAAGSPLLSDDLKSTNLETEAGKQVMEFYNRVYGENGFTNVSFDTTKGFGNGQVAMTIGAAWWAGSLKELIGEEKYAEIGVAPLPTPSGGDPGTIAYTWAWGVNSQSKHQEEAWQFLKWLNAAELEDGMTPQGTFLLDAFNVISTRQSDLESAVLQEKLNTDPTIKVFADSMEYAIEEQNPIAGAEAQDILYRLIETMWTSQLTAEETIDRAVSQVGNVL